MPLYDQLRDVIDIDYQRHLAAYDVIYEQAPRRPWQGVACGNGDLCALVWCGADSLEIVLNKSDLRTRRLDDRRRDSQNPVNACRISLRGLPLAGDDFHGRYHLHDSHFTFTRAGLCVTGYVHAERNVLSLELTGPANADLELTLRRQVNEGFGDDLGADLQDRMLLLRYRGHRECGAYSVAVTVDAAAFSAPEDAGDGNELAAVSRFRMPHAGELRLCVGVAKGSVDEDTDTLAMGEAGSFMRHTPARQWRSHGDWWRKFWPQSFLHSSVPYLDQLFYLNLNHMACCSRAAEPPKFNGGFWTHGGDQRPWGSAYTALNQTRSFMQLFSAGHPELAENMVRRVHRMLPGAKAWARERFACDGAVFHEVCDLQGQPVHDHPDLDYILSTGVLYAMIGYCHWLYTGNDKLFRECTLPVIRELCIFYRAYLKKGKDGKLHFDKSMGFETRPVGRDSASDLAAARLAIQMLLVAHRRLACLRDEEVAAWTAVHRDLADYPEWEGLISHVRHDDGTPLPVNHWVWQAPHLAPVFPFGQVDGASPQADLFRRTLERLLYTQDAGHSKIPIVASRLHDPAMARHALAHHVGKFQVYPQGHWSYIGRHQLATMGADREDADVAPDSEPQRHIDEHRIFYLEPAGIFSLAWQEVFLQSLGGTIHVFPAMPAHWRATFSLRAAGPLQVASAVADGQVQFVHVRNLLEDRSQEVRLHNPWPTGSTIEIGRSVDASRVEGETLIFTLPARAEVLLTTAGNRASLPAASTGTVVQAAPRLFMDSTVGIFPRGAHHELDRPLY